MTISMISSIIHGPLCIQRKSQEQKFLAQINYGKTQHPFHLDITQFIVPNFFTVHIICITDAKSPQFLIVFFSQLSVCVVSLKPEEIETGEGVKFQNRKKNDFLKILLNECSFLTKGKYFMVVKILSQRLGQRLVLNMYVLKFRK